MSEKAYIIIFVCSMYGNNAAWERAFCLRQRIWAISYHGSKNSCYEGLYQHLHPQAAIISAGRDNRYGHPHQEVLKALDEAHIPYYRTDAQGAVTVKFLPRGIEIYPYLSNPASTAEKAKKFKINSSFRHLFGKNNVV